MNASAKGETNMVMKLLGAVALSLLASSVISATSASTQGYPSRVVTIVVPLAAGGPADAVARALVQSISKDQPFIIENVAGGGGNIGVARVAKAKPDGYTLLFTGMGMSVSTALYSNLSYDPLKDFEYIGLVTYNPLVIVAPPDAPYKTFSEFMAYLNTRGDKVTFANSGPGSTSHLCATWFMIRAKSNATSVPFRGTAPAMTALLGKQIDLLCDSVGTAGPHIRSGALKAIGVTSKTRSDLLPDVPTLAEQGLADFEVLNWTALYAPKGTPRPIVDHLSKRVQGALVDPEFKTRLARLATTPMAPEQGTPEALATYLKEQTGTWGAVIKKANIEVR
jgi:tripartite-type tricarboxylate transporter receptor subunit TctC